MTLDLAAIKALTGAATEGPWMAASSNRRKDGYALVGEVARRGTGQAIAVLAGDPKQRHADAQFMAAARTFVPELIAEVERLQAAQGDLLELAGRLTKMVPLPVEQPACTHPRASGCPACGECACSDELHLRDPACPLHNPDSSHGATYDPNSFVGGAFAGR